MAKLQRNTIRSRIEKDLSQQLEDKKITGNHYLDLIQDYLSLWDVKCKLIDVIEEDGVRVMGAHGLKSNPSIADLNKTNAQMLKILSELGLKPVPIKEDDKGNDGDDV